jgi:hypothetical protein
MKRLFFFLSLLFLSNLAYSQDAIAHKKLLLLQSNLSQLETLIKKNNDVLDHKDYSLMLFYTSLSKEIANDIQENNY